MRSSARSARDSIPPGDDQAPPSPCGGYGLLGGLADDEVGFRRVGELDPSVLGGSTGDLDQRLLDPLRDLGFLLIGAALEPVGLHERHLSKGVAPR